MAKPIQFSMEFAADTTKAKAAIQDLTNSLNKLGNLSEFENKSTLGITKELQEASTVALTLKQNLTSAFNTSTNKLDLSKFNEQMHRSGMSLEKYKTALMQFGPEGSAAFSQLAQSITLAEIPMRRMTTLTTGLWTTLKNTAKWQLSSSLLHGFMSTLSGAYGYAQDLNKSLNNIRIVTGDSTEKMAKFAEEANKAARALHTTTTSYTDAALIFYQQGLGDAAVKERTDVAIKLANVTGQTAQEISDQMTAVWNNFDDGSQSLEHYADVITKLGARTASSSKEITEGLGKFAAVADTVGLSYEYATTALATVVAQTRQSADTVGTAFKTLFSRIEQLKQTGSTEEGDTTLGQYSQALANVGINIKTATGELKDMDSILNETGARWSTLARDQQVALAQSVAGVRQYQQFIALMDNWGTFQQNLIYAQQSEGALQEQADIYAESWEAASKKVKASAQSIYSALLDDQFFIDFTNGFSSFLDIIKDVIDNLGGMKGTLLALGTIFVEIFQKQIAESVGAAGYSISMLFGGKKMLTGLQQQASQMLMTEQTETGTVGGSAMATAQKAQAKDQANYLFYSQKMSDTEKELYGQVVKRNAALAEGVKELGEQADQTERLVNQTRAAMNAPTKRYNNKTLFSNDDLNITKLTSNLDNATESKEVNNVYEKIKQQFNDSAEAVKKFGRDGVDAFHSLEESMNKAGATIEEEKTALNEFLTKLKEIKTTSIQNSQISDKQETNILQAYRANALNNGTLSINAQEIAQAERSGDIEKQAQAVEHLRTKLLMLKQAYAETGSMIEQFGADGAHAFEKLFDAVSSGEISIQDAREALTAFSETVQTNAASMSESLDTWLKKQREINTQNNIDKGMDPIEAKQAAIEQATAALNDYLQKLQELANKETGATVKGQELNVVIEQSEAGYKKAAIGSVTLSEAITQLGSIVMSTTMLVNQIANVIEVFNNKQSTTKEKIMAVATAASFFFMMLPSFLKIFTSFKTKIITGFGEINASAGVIGLIALALTAVITAISIFATRTDETTQRLEEAREAQERFNESIQKTTQSFKNLNDAFSKYDEIKQGLDSCSESTKEWAEYLKQAHDLYQDFIINNADLLQLYRQTTGTDPFQYDQQLRTYVLTDAFKEWSKTAQVVTDQTFELQQRNNEKTVALLEAKSAENELSESFEREALLADSGIKSIWASASVTDDADLDNDFGANKLAKVFETDQISGQLYEYLTTKKDATDKEVENWADYVANLGGLDQQGLERAYLPLLQDMNEAYDLGLGENATPEQYRAAFAELDADTLDQIYHASGINFKDGQFDFATVNQSLQKYLGETLKGIYEPEEGKELLNNDQREKIVNYSNAANTYKSFTMGKAEEDDIAHHLITGTLGLLDNTEASQYGPYATRVFEKYGTDIYNDVYGQALASLKDYQNEDLYKELKQYDPTLINTHMKTESDGTIKILDKDDKEIASYSPEDLMSRVAVQKALIDDEYQTQMRGYFAETYKNAVNIAPLVASDATAVKQSNIDIQDAISNLTKRGDIIKKDDYNKQLTTLSKELLDKYFTEQANGDYMLVGDPEELRQEITKELQNKLTNSEGNVQFSVLAEIGKARKRINDVSYNLTKDGLEKLQTGKFNELSQYDKNVLLEQYKTNDINEAGRGYQDEVAALNNAEDAYVAITNTVEELNNLKEQGYIDSNKYNQEFETIAIKEAKALGLDYEAIIENAKAIQETSEAINKLSLNDKEREQLSKRLALANARQAKGLEQLTTDYNKQKNVLEKNADLLKDTSDAGKQARNSNAQLHEILTTFRKDLAQALDLDSYEDLSEDLVIAAYNAGDLEAAINGDAEALERISRLAAQENNDKTINTNVVNKKQLQTQFDEINEFIETFDFNKMEIGAELNNNIYEAFNKLIEEGATTAEAVSKTLESIGYEPTITYKAVQMDANQQVASDGYYIDEKTGKQVNLNAGQSMGVKGTFYIPVIGEDTHYQGPPAARVTTDTKKDSGGGGKTTATKREKKITDTRYKEIDDSLEDLSQTMKKVQRAQDQLYGKTAIQNLETQNKLIRKQIALDEKKIKEAEEYQNADLTGDRAELIAEATKQGLALQFDADGDIANYKETIGAKVREYNDAVRAFNEVYAGQVNAPGEEEAKANLDAMKVKIDDLLELQKQYEATKKLIEDLKDEEEELKKQILANNYQKITLELEYKIQLPENDLKRIQNSIKLTEDNIYKLGEAFSFTKAQFDDYASKYDLYHKAVNKATKEYKNGNISKADYLTLLQEEYDNIQDLISSYEELDDTMMEYYGNVLEKISEHLGKFTGQLDHLNGVLDHYKNIVALTNKKENKAITADILAARTSNSKNLYDSYASEYAMYREQQEQIKANLAGAKNDAEKEYWQKQLDAITEKVNEAEDNMLASAEEYLKNLQEEWKNTMQNLGEEFENAMTGTYETFENLQKNMELTSTRADEYLTKTNQIYETNKMMRQLQKDIDATDNKVAKQRLGAFEKEITAAQEKNELSNLELEILQAKYAQLQAEIALEEAQNAKSTVRLQRDSEGNYGYVYTADQNAVDGAQDALDQAANDLYNIRLRAANEYSEKIIQAETDMKSAIEAIWNDETLTLEQKQEREREIREKYYAIIESYQDLYGIATEEDSRVVADAWSSAYRDITTDTESWKNATEEYCGQAKAATKECEDAVDQFEKEAALDLESIKGKTKDVKTESENLAKTVQEKEIPAMKNLLAEVNKVSEGYAKQRSEILATIEAMKTYADSVDKTRSKTANEGEDDGSGGPGSGNAQWYQDEKGWWYGTKDANGKATSWAHSGWAQDSKGDWYYFDKEGYMVEPDANGTITVEEADGHKYSWQVDTNHNGTYGKWTGEEPTSVDGGTYVAGGYKKASWVGQQPGSGSSSGQKSQTNKYGANSFLVDNVPTFFTTGYNSTIKAAWMDANGGIQHAETGWHEANGKKWYMASPGLYYARVAGASSNSGWAKIGDRYYQFGTNGFVVGDVNGITYDDLKKKYYDVKNDKWRNDVDPEDGLDLRDDEQYLDWDRWYSEYKDDEDLEELATGGYTGEWNDGSGKLALLHSKELVLDANDTANMLAVVDMVRNIVDMIDLNALNAVGRFGFNAASVGRMNDVLEQNVHITAEFPSVTSHTEIEDAFNNLINRASQYVNRTNYI